MLLEGEAVCLCSSLSSWSYPPPIYSFRNLTETDLNKWLCWWASGGRSKYRQRPPALLLAKAHRLFCVLAFLEMEHFHVAIIPWKLFALKMLTTLPDKGSDPIPATPYPHYAESAEHDRIECRWCLCKRVWHGTYCNALWGLLGNVICSALHGIQF